MIGLLVGLLISWLLLWFFERKHLSALGLMPTKARTRHLATGLLLAAVCCFVYHAMGKVFSGSGWTLNRQLTFTLLLAGFWWTLKSVLFEELLFRGALLYIAIKKMGANKACLLSAVCFGVYHWFSYNAFGNIIQIVIVFLMTAIFGYMLAYAFAKTKSMYLPIGLHLGWNLVNILVFSNGPLGQQVFIKTNNQLQGILSLTVFLFQVLALPILTYLYLNKFGGKRSR